MIYISCDQDNIDEFYYVDTEVRAFFDSFEAEGKMRGFAIDLAKDGIKACIKVIIEDDVVGQCQTSANGSHTIIIDKERWDLSNHYEREFIVFHELGHCYLQRGHLNTKDQNGFCLSMMHGDASVCRNAYALNKRKDYIDELFLN